MESKEFWKLIGKMFGDEQLGAVRGEENWEKTTATVKIKSVL